MHMLGMTPGVDALFHCDCDGQYTMVHLAVYIQELLLKSIIQAGTIVILFYRQVDITFFVEKDPLFTPQYLNK